MKLGVILPQYEIGLDCGALRAFAQAVEGLGYQYLVAFDSLYTENPWHEPLVFYAFLAGWTQKLELTTGVIVAPSRQTLLLAKQAASLDVLSGGRLRLGLGVGWNKTEFEAMNADFQSRGPYIEEQMDVLRALWTQPTVTFQGKWHHLRAAHMPPLPLQRPIPIWLGGWAEAVLQRVGRLADGWTPVFVDLRDAAKYEDLRGKVARLRDYTGAAGRPVDAVGIDAQSGVRLQWGGEETWATLAAAWRSVGATHLSVDTMGANLTSVDAHIDALSKIKEVLDA
ncbi:MAG TPA: LLM class F420-dependent oxidoreductase [Ktedonobacterales bacterium]